MRARIATVACLFCLTAPPAIAATADQVEAWFESQLELSRSGELLTLAPNLAITFEWEIHSNITDSEAQRLRREVADRPEHLDRQRVQDYDFLHENGPERYRYTIRVRESGSWRISQDSRVGYMDTAAHDGVAWTMTPDLLKIAEPEKQDEGKQLVADERWVVRRRLNEMLLGSVRLVDYWKMEPQPPVALADDRWRIPCEREGEQAGFIELEWSDEHDRGFIGRVVRLDPTRSETTVTGWRRSEALDRWVADLIETRGADGTLMGRLRTVSIEQEPPERFERLVQVPPVNGADPIRGETTFTSIYDFRDGTTRVQGPDGETRTGRIETQEQNEKPLFRAVGIVAAGAIIIALIVLRIRRQ